MTPPDLNHLLAVAETAADAAGQHALDNMGRRSEVHEQFAHDVKLVLDRECQEKATRAILETFPRAVILGEEGAERPSLEQLVWIIDPIDGTVNYQHGLPLWGSSVAVRDRGRTLAGVVYLPALGERYTATTSDVARCNGEPIHVSDTPVLAESVVLTGLSKYLQEEAPFETFRDLARKTQKIRVRGSAAADMCHVARGWADGYFESGIYLWDWAAASLIAERAGGRFELLEEASDLRCRCLCTNGRIHARLAEIVDTGDRLG